MTGQGGKNDPNSPPEDRRLPIGSSTRRSAPGGIDIKSLLNIARTNNDYSLCVRAGVWAFFGLGDFANDYTPPDVFAKSILDSIKAPEHSVIQARAFLRSFLVIADSMKSVVAAFQSNPLAGSKQILNFTNVLIHSRFLGAVNTFAVLGDAVLSFSEDTIDTDASDGFGRKISRMDADAAKFGNGNAHTMNRLVNGKKLLTLAWASMTSPDLGITNPRSRQLELNEFAKIKTRHLAGDGVIDRIRKDDVDAIEIALDAEYFPFYFHDLRTNEIVSFHAFLASLGESYTATYDTVEGFGRVDPVKIYKNTHRKIDLSFYIAATSDDDFQHMWGKINKLATLMYPQYTEGKQINSSIADGAIIKNYKFFAPFSQQIAASPMIRLRVGDLIRSNYSKYNLARMFGYQNHKSQFGVTAEQITLNDSPKFDLGDETHVKKAFDISNNQGNKFRIAGAGFITYILKYRMDAYKNHISNPQILIKELDFIFDKVIDGQNLIGTDGKKNLDCLVKFKVEKNNSASPPKIFQRAVGNAVQQFLDSIENGFNVPGKDTGQAYGFYREGGSVFFVGKRGDFRMRDELYDSVISQVEAGLAAENSATNTKIANIDAADAAAGTHFKTIKSFIDTDNNAVVKSFESVGGKGLPGFIDSMNFDWHDKVTWAGVGSSGAKAPKICKVTISFTPIHDISPGLDAFGINRAPIYPIANDESDAFPAERLVKYESQ